MFGSMITQRINLEELLISLLRQYFCFGSGECSIIQTRRRGIFSNQSFFDHQTNRFCRTVHILLIVDASDVVVYSVIGDITIGGDKLLAMALCQK